MAIREFKDDRGRDWRVWDVYPTLVERRQHQAGPPTGTPERRRTDRPRARLRQDLTRGWLVFEARDGERRRFAPIPGPEWADVSDHQLRRWCMVAETARLAKRPMK